MVDLKGPSLGVFRISLTCNCYHVLLLYVKMSIHMVINFVIKYSQLITRMNPVSGSFPRSLSICYSIGFPKHPLIIQSTHTQIIKKEETKSLRLSQRSRTN